MHLQPDSLLQNRYRIVGLIAQGGMGAVYQAVDTRLGNTVALKQTLMADPLPAGFGSSGPWLDGAGGRGAARSVSLERALRG